MKTIKTTLVLLLIVAMSWLGSVSQARAAEFFNQSCSIMDGVSASCDIGFPKRVNRFHATFDDFEGDGHIEVNHSCTYRGSKKVPLYWRDTAN